MLSKLFNYTDFNFNNKHCLPLPCSMTACDSVCSSKPVSTSHLCSSKLVCSSNVHSSKHVYTNVCKSKPFSTSHVRSSKSACVSNVRLSKSVCTSNVCSSKPYTPSHDCRSKPVYTSNFNTRQAISMKCRKKILSSVFFLSALFSEFLLLGIFIDNNFYLISNNKYSFNKTSKRGNTQDEQTHLILYITIVTVFYRLTILTFLVIFVHLSHCMFLNALV